MRKLGILLLAIFTLGSVAMAQRPDLPGSLVVDYGLNSFRNAPTDVKLNSFKSKTVNVVYYYDFPIGDRGFTFTPGFGLGLERFSFEDNKMLTSTVNSANERSIAVSDVATVYPQANTLNESKLGLNYFDIPLELRFYSKKDNMSRGFRAAIGAKVGILYSSFTKVKLEDNAADSRMIKDRQDLGFQRFRYGVQARVGFGGISLFGYYELSDKFDIAPAGGLDAQGVAFGISLTGF